MRETLYAEVDLTDAVVDLVKQGHYSGVTVAIFGPTHPSNPKPGHHYLPNRRAYETVSEARKGIADYLCYFNEERPHQGLDNRTPNDVFYQRKPLFKAA